MGNGLTEDEAPRPKTLLARPSLDALGVAELEAYIAELRSEIARAEQDIVRKQGHRATADSVFKRPS
jgi:uncharacterized small protein (DUF1192 family)